MLRQSTVFLAFCYLPVSLFSVVVKHIKALGML